MTLGLAGLISTVANPPNPPPYTPASPGWSGHPTALQFPASPRTLPGSSALFRPPACTAVAHGVSINNSRAGCLNLPQVLADVEPSRIEKPATCFSNNSTGCLNLAGAPSRVPCIREFCLRRTSPRTIGLRQTCAVLYCSGSQPSYQ